MTDGAHARWYTKNWTSPVTRNTDAVPSTHARARPRSGVDIASQPTITATVAVRVAAATISPRRSSRANAASSRARAPGSATLTRIDL
jgi:hypothetical protein